ncbi:histidine kinase N-terminal 7TM domain-containing diguanylate cyclase [Bacillus rubiinfantis]|uniref:histidine kinase N-terminal 7TM domain-containing diguanylate cyclase n=1 Tax=Bacillus rubiinfantis TaxID=1499680 RepID=UPI0005A7A638|nr:histidine kinase N-terminal 7TM domain-containing protein [Bacillus rubiinfantis]
MDVEIFRYIVLICVSGVLSILLGAYAFFKREVFADGKLFMLMSIFSSTYIFGHALELSSRTLGEVVFWQKIQYLGLPFIAPSCLVLIFRFTRLDKFLSRKRILLLFSIPIVTLILSLTNEWHHLFYRQIYVRLNETTLLTDFIAGPWYMIHGSYTFGILLFNTVVVMWYWKQTQTTYWRQNLTLILGQLIPMTAAFLYLMGLSPKGIDPVPIVMCITSTLYFWAIFSAKLFVLAPIARNRIFESMRDGVLVIDESNRVVDFNKAAKQIVEKLQPSAIGQKIHTIWTDSNLYLAGDSIDSQEFEWKQADKCYHVWATPVLKNNELVGRTIVFTDITEKKKLEEQLKQLAYNDGLTKIYNRTYFIEKSKEELEKALNQGYPLSLFLFDIDFFKKINDKYGHSIGDLALCHVVDTCRRGLQSEHTFARYGGEEFVACLPNTNRTNAAIIAEKVRKLLQDTPLQTATETISITASFGVASLSPDANTLDFLLQEADEALYRSKESGRNKVSLAEERVLLVK